MKVRYLPAIAGVAALVLAGCGGGDDSSNDQPAATISAQDEAAITKVSAELEKAAKTKDGKAVCALLQPDLVEKTFGSKARCAKAAGPGLGDAGLEDLEIKSITATSSGASVIFKNAPGQNASFVKVDGNWYVDPSDSNESNSSSSDG